MTESRRRDHWLFVSDVDDTLLGDDKALAHLASVLKDDREHFALAFNSSRPCASLRQSLAEHSLLPQPDYLIGALGTEIEHRESGEMLEEYSRSFAADWQRDEVAALVEGLGFEAHAPEYQTPFKASYHVPGTDNYQRVMARLAKTDLRVKAIYSAERNLDIIPIAAGKGKAADYLRRRIGLPGDRVVVAGDSANDLDMFVSPFKGIIVANADPVLKALSGHNVYHAASPYATGVLEGLRHWGAVDTK